jgi:hypothetical protein
LESDSAEISYFLDTLPQEAESWSRVLTLHVNHLRMFINTAIIALHRPYINSAPEHLATADQGNLQRTAVQRSKNAAGAITSILNKLISSDMIDTSPTMIITAMTFAMEIHFFELARCQGLTRHTGTHNLNLHMMVLAHLKKTYWTADMQHNLFTECLKALSNARGGDTRLDGGLEAVQQDSAPATTPYHGREYLPCSTTTMVDSTALGEGAFEEIFGAIHPFENLQCLFDPRYVLGDI